MAKGKGKNGNNKKIIWGGTVIVASVITLFFVFTAQNKSVPHQNFVDVKISQYSDKNITKNAIVANPEFKKMAFESIISTKQSFLSSQMASVVNTLKSFTKTFGAKDEPKEYGSWVWTPIMSMPPEYVDSILSDAKTNGINVIYLSIDSYLDAFVMPKGAERERQRKAFVDKVDDFIGRANRLGIAVDAEAGWRNWAEVDNTYKAFAVVNFAKNFNLTHTNKFRGFQYDVEPYLLDSYEKNKVSVLSDYVELIDKTERFLEDSDLKFGIAVPDFYDGKDEMTPKFSYGGKKDYVFKHLLNILDRREGNSIIIMSYRAFAEGFDGSIEISQNEMKTARSAGNTKIIIAQETGEVLPQYITFHRTSKDRLFSEIGKINNAFNSYSNFGGIAIHYANAFLALK